MFIIFIERWIFFNTHFLPLRRRHATSLPVCGCGVAHKNLGTYISFLTKYLLLLNWLGF